MIIMIIMIMAVTVFVLVLVFAIISRVPVIRPGPVVIRLGIIRSVVVRLTHRGLRRSGDLLLLRG